jgi:ferrous iron transport protein B
MSALAEQNSSRGVTIRNVALTGNPNCGKTTLFNALTGLRAKVGNYAGVTVERKEGRLLGSSKENPITVLDLPGTYSLSPQSLDEQIARDVLFHRLPDVPPPDLVVVVVDASNLQRNLYFATQVIELGYPTIIALNMIDVARENGHEINTELLARELGVPVLPLVASRKKGISELRERILVGLHAPSNPRRFAELPPAYAKEMDSLASLLAEEFPEPEYRAEAEAALILGDERFLTSSAGRYPDRVREEIRASRERLEKARVDWRSAAIEARYVRLAEIQAAVTTETAVEGDTLSDKLDRVFTHKVWGLLIFVLIMTAMFQSIFSFAEWPMEWLEKGVESVGGWVGTLLGPGPLRSLLVDGVVAGVGAVIVFLPQICLLFLFIGLLEDTGYMARAAFLMDRLMSKVGLHGKSFIPMLSSFACAIPGIMATRTIESPKDRLVTILVAPLMSCSARLPVYTVLIAACIPDKSVLGFLKLSGLTMLAMYLLGIIVALLMAWLFKKTLLKGPTPLLIMELPPYKRPGVLAVFRHMWERSKIFLRRAGTVILGISILLWFLATYPKSESIEQTYATERQQIEAQQLSPEQTEARLAAIDKKAAGARLRHSFAGRLGHAIEPVVRPLGFDWQIGIGIVASFAAREVFVSTMSLVYNVGELQDDDKGTQTLAEVMKTQRYPNGAPVYTTLVGITLMVFYVFALQCVSTVAIVRRETNSWKWPAFQWAYMGALAWLFAFITYQGGKLLGF